MNRQFALVACASIALLGRVTAARAAIVTYTNRALWQASAGAITASENFNSFTADTSFQVPNSPVLLNGFSLVEIGTVNSRANLVDVAPLVVTTNDVNGTPFADCAADFGKYYVKLQFTSPASAFGADFTNQGAPAEALHFDIYNSNDALLGTIIPAKAVNVFNGFTATGGDEASYMILHSTAEGGNGIRSAWGMDNVDIAAVPEPSTLLLALAALAFVPRRRR